MNDKQLAEIEARLNATTPRPWSLSFRTNVVGPGGSFDMVATCGNVFQSEANYVRNCANADFIIAAPADIAALIAEVRRLQSENTIARDYVDTLVDYAVEHVAWYKATHPNKEYEINDMEGDIAATRMFLNANPPTYATPSIDAGVMGREEGTR